MATRPQYYGLACADDKMFLNPITQSEYERYSEYSGSHVMHMYRFSTENENTMVCVFPKTHDIFLKSRYTLFNSDCCGIQAWLWYTKYDDMYQVHGATAEVEETSAFTDANIRRTIDIKCAIDIIDIYNCTHTLLSKVLGCDGIATQLVIHTSCVQSRGDPPLKYIQHIKYVQERVPCYVVSHIVYMDALHRASSLISACFKGWKARMKYRFSPYTKLGQYIILKGFSQLLEDSI